MKTCTVEGCAANHHAHGLCQYHYDRRRFSPHIPLDAPRTGWSAWIHHGRPMPCPLDGITIGVMHNHPTATADSAKERDYASHDWPMSEWEPDAEYTAALTWDDPAMVTDAERRLADWWERDRRIQNAHRLSMMSVSLETAAD